MCCSAVFLFLLLLLLLQTIVSFWEDLVHNNTTVEAAYKLHAAILYFSLHPLLPWCIMNVRLHMVVSSNLTLAPDYKEEERNVDFAKYIRSTAKSALKSHSISQNTVFSNWNFAKYRKFRRFRKISDFAKYNKPMKPHRTQTFRILVAMFWFETCALRWEQ